ncbi:MAG: restriction endonuclease [Turicibacter sp.]
MGKIINNIGYIVIAITVFNFFYGWSDRVVGWSMWNWYLVILAVTVGTLLYIKVKQVQHRAQLETIREKNEQIRLSLLKKDHLETLYKMNDDDFNQLIVDLYKLEGVESIEVTPYKNGQGFHLLMWHQGTKMILKWFKQKPCTDFKGDVESFIELEGEKVSIEQVREFFGIKNDFNVQADEAILLTTTSYTDEVFEFAKRNNLTLLDGTELLNKISQLKKMMNDR